MNQIPPPVLSPDAAMPVQPPKPLPRWWVFVPVFLVVFLLGSLWALAEPESYRSEALLRVEVGRLADPLALGAVGPGDDELRRLRSPAMMEQLVARFIDRAPHWTPETLAAQTHVTAAGMDDIGLSVRSGDPQLAHDVLSEWIAIYISESSVVAEQSVDDGFAEVARQLELVEAKLAQRNDALEQFRARYAIVTLNRDDTEVMGRYQALNSSLEAAQEEELKASARLRSAEDALAAGEAQVAPESRAELNRIAAQLKVVEGKLEGLEARFTDTYLRLNPQTRDLKEAREELRQTLQIAQREAVRTHMLNLRQTWRDAQAEARALALRTDQARAEASEYAARNGEYQAMLVEVDDLQAQVLDLRRQRDDMDVQQPTLATRVSVLTPPSLPEGATNASMGSIFATFGLIAALVALVITKLVDYLVRPPKDDRPDPIQIVQNIGTPPPAYPGMPGSGAPMPHELPRQPGHDRLGHAERPNAELSAPQQRLAAPEERRELVPTEIAQLWQDADATSRLLIAGLMRGISSDELAALEAAAVTPDGQWLEIDGDTPRRLSLDGHLGEALAALQPDLPLSGYLLRRADGAAWRSSDVHAQVTLLAHDAGLAQAREIDADSLRHAYIAHLVRQGARLSELNELIGGLDAAELAEYGALAPPGRARALHQVDLEYRF